jgi:hypothetical protein
MDVVEILKKLKDIKPRKEFTETSRVLILNTAPKPKLNFWNILIKNIELGASLALAGLLIFLVIGGFSAWKMFSPIQISNIDPSALKAEAQAIDMQIQLANLSYQNVSASRSGESTPPSAPAAANNTSNKNQAKPNPEASASTSTQLITIDEALQKLSE